MTASLVCALKPPLLASRSRPLTRNYAHGEVREGVHVRTERMNECDGWRAKVSVSIRLSVNRKPRLCNQCGFSPRACSPIDWAFGHSPSQPASQPRSSPETDCKTQCLVSAPCKIYIASDSNNQCICICGLPKGRIGDEVCTPVTEKNVRSHRICLTGQSWRRETCQLFLE